MKPSAAKSLNPQVVTRIDGDIYYTFDTKNLQGRGFDTEELAKSYVKREAIPDLPIRDTKKFVELVLNEMIRKAVKDGRDSIAITNGQIQYNRYEAMPEKKRLGLKKVYNTIHYDQLNKIAKNYGVELERIDISKVSEPTEGGDLERISSKIRTATRDGYELKKVNLQFLWDRTKDTAIPDHASLYTNEGRGQGAEYIEDWLHNLVDNRAFSPETGQGSGYPKWEKIKNDEVYIWIKERDISRDLIGWEMPIIPVRDASNVEAQTQAQSTDVGFYQNYLKNYKPPEGIDLGYEQDAEQLIKMKFPKKLQHKKLSESQRLTELYKQKPPIKDQTQRLFT